MSEDNRREHDRVPVRVGIEVRSEAVDEFVDHKIRDISVGGLFLELDQPLERGTTLEFRLKVGDKEIVTGLGKVRWARPPDPKTELPAGVGIQFISLEGASGAVEAFIEQQQTEAEKSDDEG